MTTLVDVRNAVRASTRRPPWVILATVIVWITIVLAVDSRDTSAVQHVLGLLTWGVLLVLLAKEPVRVRLQTAVVVVFASAVEYTFSPLLGVYLYRFHNVPWYVPPGHGLVYLAALSVGRMAFVHLHRRALTALVLAVGGCWSAYGLLVADRTDVLGAFWFLCLVGFLLWGPSPGLYIGAFFVVSYLELLGTSLGTWAWQPHDPTGIVAIGNPPSGAAGGYGWFDLAALLLTRPRASARRGSLTPADPAADRPG